jgi:hypothetical protein
MDGVWVTENASWEHSYRGAVVHGPYDAWIVGTEGVISQWFGSGWGGLGSFAYCDLHQASSFGSTALAVGAWGGLVRLESGKWQNLSSQVHDLPLRAIWAASPDRVWAVGGNHGKPAGFNGGLMLAWDGQTWSEVPGIGKALFGVWAAEEDDAWAVGAGPTVLHWDGVSWEKVSTPAKKTLRRVWGLDASHVWVVGDEGQILFFDGETWALVPAGSWNGATLRDVWASGPDDVWAVGSLSSCSLGDFYCMPMIVHWDGTSWTLQPNPVEDGILTPILTSVWGFGEDELWVAGDLGFVARIQGGVWTPWNLSTVVTFEDLWGPSPDDLWLGGRVLSIDDEEDSLASKDTVFRWNGQAWEDGMAHESPQVYGLHGIGTTHLWVVGGGESPSWPLAEIMTKVPCPPASP